MNLYFLSYNNYYNRIIKKPLNSINAYIADGAELLYQINDVINWNPNDGVSATQTLPTGVAEQVGDYMLAIDNSGEIHSRWYITDETYNVRGQYQVSLLRDVIADYWEEVINAPTFVEKANVPVEDPAIYNAEPYTTNQILQRKDLLYDETGCPWIVGYVPKTWDGGTVNFNFFPQPDYEVSGIQNWTHYDLVDEAMLGPSSIIPLQTIYRHDASGDVAVLRLGANPTNLPTLPIRGAGEDWIDGPEYNGTFSTGRNLKLSGSISANMTTTSFSAMKDNIKNAVSAFTNYEGLYNAAKTKIGMSDANTLIYQLSGKYIKDTTTSTFYKATLKYEDMDVDMEVANDEALWFLLSPIGSAPNNATMNNLRVSGKVPVIKLVLEKVGAKGVITISENRTHLQDQPYDMFCIPYSDDMLFKYTDGDNTFVIPYTKSLAMSFAQQLAADLGNEVIYDVQILPYCPVPNLYTEEEGSGVMTYRDVAATYIEDGNGNPISAIFWAATSAFSVEIPYTIELPQSALDRKLMSVCQKYRMCSPNMASFFDFDPVLNDGVAVIEVDCYYKPYNPYIHLNPRFGGIYGSADYEVRGLDLAGDFSLTQITDAWTEYQLQNKNFEAMFNRQQESLRLQNKYQHYSDLATAATGALSAGATVGMTMGPWAGVGAGALSLGAGVADVFMNQKLRNEQISLNEDLYAYQLGNIQALPNTLTKIDTLSPNNPNIPYIEVYDCFPEERNAIRNALIYNGMTVGRIATIGQFLQEEPSYMKGYIIRMTGLGEDYHIVQTIANTLQQGVYM